MTDGLVVVGASLAGVRAVTAARRGGYPGPVTLVGAEAELPYDRPPLSKAYLLAEGPPAATYHHTPEELRELGVELRLGHPATALDAAARAVVVDGREVRYDRLVVATGVAARRPATLAALPGVHTLRSLADAAALRRDLRAARRVLVVGAGLIGSEIASAARSLGREVTLVDAAATPLQRATGDRVGTALAGLHVRHGVRLLTGTGLVELRGRDRVTGALFDTGEEVAADLVVLGVGGRPNTDWLVGSGVALHADGGIVCDEYLQTSVPDVYAAGDLVHWPNGRLGTTARLENWVNATEQGARAAVNALFPDRRAPHESVPYFWSDWYGNRIQFVGAVGERLGVVSGGLAEDRFVVTYETGGRLVGAVALNEPSRIMRFRRLVGGPVPVPVGE